ncbi:hypothetical protein A1O1_06760 [Capronia coronata CBS 617.96]|uniref:Murein transglycosylase n=1 Tax=Capronia coronata CBS 617.96 TaxID=1182541 RepID=W9Y1L1_9EURO|nr:uncharacterized protein A1O1_06760 [Capronia coronata CBS 617.96]EXJ83141.1 hypothetical protein A1O1_06760 [Capronia coronata CBS 617.96]
MKLTSIALTAAAATVAVAQPHNHAHRHLHEHKQRAVTMTTYAASPTAYVYLLDGQEISAEEVCDGLQDNALKFVDGSDPGVCSSSAAASTSISVAVPTTTPAVPTTAAAEPTTTSEAPTTSSAAASSSGPAEFYQAPASSSSASASEAPSSSSASAAPSASASASVSSSGTGISAPFPDGQLSCSQFPSDYGAVALDYLGLGGWSGLQAVTIAGGFVNHIVTGVSGDTCREGMMCSYACPPGYQKAQWPSTQGSTGQSVGGLSCSGGVLRLTNPSLSSTLCIAGVGGVQATNKASGVVAICRTDYPGTESETIPVELQAGETEALAVPDAATYYTWEGKSTSAQYYLNPIGYPASKACQWGSPGTPLGNYAPINFGVGASGGVTWLSIFQNSPTTSAQYEGTVELQGNLSGSCKYQNGQYCSSTGCNSNGCTVSVISGTATYVISS